MCKDFTSECEEHDYRIERHYRYKNFLKTSCDRCDKERVVIVSLRRTTILAVPSTGIFFQRLFLLFLKSIKFKIPTAINIKI